MTLNRAGSLAPARKAVSGTLAPTHCSPGLVSGVSARALIAKVTELGFVQSPAGVYVTVTAAWAVVGAT